MLAKMFASDGVRIKMQWGQQLRGHSGFTTARGCFSPACGRLLSTCPSDLYLERDLTWTNSHARTEFALRATRTTVGA